MSGLDLTSCAWFRSLPASRKGRISKIKIVVDSVQAVLQKRMPLSLVEVLEAFDSVQDPNIFTTSDMIDMVTSRVCEILSRKTVDLALSSTRLTQPHWLLISCTLDLPRAIDEWYGENEFSDKLPWGGFSTLANDSRWEETLLACHKVALHRFKIIVRAIHNTATTYSVSRSTVVETIATWQTGMSLGATFTHISSLIENTRNVLCPSFDSFLTQNSHTLQGSSVDTMGIQAAADVLCHMFNQIRSDNDPLCSSDISDVNLNLLARVSLSSLEDSADSTLCDNQSLYVGSKARTNENYAPSPCRPEPEYEVATFERQSHYTGEKFSHIILSTPRESHNVVSKLSPNVVLETPDHTIFKNLGAGDAHTLMVGGTPRKPQLRGEFQIPSEEPMLPETKLPHLEDLPKGEYSHRFMVSPTPIKRPKLRRTTTDSSQTTT